MEETKDLAQMYPILQSYHTNNDIETNRQIDGPFNVM